MSTHVQLKRRYRDALQLHLKSNQPIDPASIRAINATIQRSGLRTIEMIAIHEHILIAAILPGIDAKRRSATILKSARFFAAAIVPENPVGGGSTQRIVTVNHMLISALSQRTVELATSNLDLHKEVDLRKQTERSLMASEQRNVRLLDHSLIQQRQMQRLSRQILSTQEDERREISRELHDVIAQTLTGINVRLSALKRKSILDTKEFDRNLVSTQRLVEKAVAIVHRFARDLRPTALDDLGLIPALQAFLVGIRTRSGINIALKACAEVENLSMAKRTVLFRVAQEAFTNIHRHARATRASLTITTTPTGFRMEIHDDGKSFAAQDTLLAQRGKRLGILGMRERLDMVGGSFEISSSAGQGTTILADIPLGPGKRKSISSANLKGPT